MTFLFASLIGMSVSVCLSVCLYSREDTKGSLLCRLSVRLSFLSYFSRHTSLFCNNSSSTEKFKMKLHTVYG